MLIVKLSTAVSIEIGPVLDSVGVGVEYASLAIGELRLVKNGTGAAMASAASITHVANGHYTLSMTTGNTDTLGTLTVSCHKTGYQMPRAQMMVVPVKVYDSIVAGSDNLEVDAIQLLGTAILTPATAGTLDVNTKLLGGATVTATTSVTIPASSTLATTTNITSITGNITGNLSGSVGSVTGNVGGSVASVVGAVGSVTGLTAANLDTTISSRASQTSLDTLDDLVDTEVGAIKTKTDQLTFTVANQVDSNSLSVSATGIRTAVGLATANLDTQIATLATPTNITAGTITTVTNLTNAATSGDLTATMKSSVTTAVPTVSQTADQVWDELLSGHTTVGSTGAGLSAAGAAGDPWSTLIPGSYGAGTAGKIVGDNVNATISSRASQTSLDTLDDYVDTEIGAIKTKTDQLTFTVANQIDANSLTIGANVITASALATDAVNEIQSGLATPTNITAGTITTVTNLTNAATSGDLTATMKSSVTTAVPTVSQTADQVWDELLSGHTGAGSTGAGLTSASSAGDPWSTALPGSYGAGTAGKIVGDNINATIGGRMATYTQPTGFLAATFPVTVASPTNITAGTITTVTNLTNSATSGDLTATMKSSVTTAVPTVVQIQSGLATPTNITSASGIAVSSIGVNVITASALATDAVNEIQSGLATPTNITAATGVVLSAVTHTGARIPNVTLTDTATNLTNAATSGDLTSTMKSSVTAAVPTAAQNFAAVLTTALTESYAADNVAPTLAQAILLIQQSLHEFAISSTTRTVKKLDGSTTAATFTLDSATAPTSTTRAT